MKIEDLKKNPETARSFLVTALAAILFLFTPPILGLIALIVSSRLLLKAKKIGEDKKIRKIGNVVLYLPLLIWVAEVALWVITTLQKQQ